MNFRSLLRSIPAHFLPNLATFESLPGRGIRWGFLLLFLLFPGGIAPAANQFVKVDNPGFSSGQTRWSSAWGDYDGDGYIDLLLAGLRSGNRLVNDLYRNNGNGTFTRKTAAEVGAIVDDRPLPSYTNPGSIFWADYNNDGLLDLLVLPVTAGGATAFTLTCRLYINQGNGTFTSADAGALTRLQVGFSANAGARGDYDNDGWLDIFLSGADGAAGNHKYNLLFRGVGEGTFERVTNNAVALEEITTQWGSYGGEWVDTDDDGDLDLLALIGDPSNSFYRNDGHGRFTRLTDSLLEVAESTGGFGDWGDYDNDGDLDHASGPGLLVNNGGGAFVLSALSLPVGPAWVDYDNDGDLDLSSDIYDNVAGDSYTVLYRNDGQGNLVETEDAFTYPTVKYRQGTWGDYDNDGFLDVYLTSGADSTGRHLFHNQGNENRWIKFVLQGTAANRSAIGAKVRVKATIGGKAVWQLRVVSPNATQAISQNDLRPNFGLGNATVAEEVRIEWPSGNLTVLTNLAANQIVPVTEVVNIEPARPVTVINGNVSLTNTLAASSRQWYFETGAIAGATGPVLTLTSVQPSQTGRYTVVAQTDAGPQTNHVYVRVVEQFTRILEGPLVTKPRRTYSATWFDDDNDGLLDVVLNSMVDASSTTLLHHQGEGTFSPVESTNPMVAKKALHSAAADLDNDGDVDICVGRQGVASGLYRNDGAGVFTAVTGTPAALRGNDNMDVAWADYDRDGDLDLLVAIGGNVKTDDGLFRNNGDGTFTALTSNQAGEIVDDGDEDFDCTWVDYNNDGWPDAVVQHWTLGRRVHRNNGDGTFTRLEAGSLTSGADHAMGNHWGDFDNDGYLDVFAGWAADLPALHHNLGGLSFTNVTAFAGLASPSLALCTGAWGDYDNDGFLDLVAGKQRTICRNRGDGTFQIVDFGQLTDAPTYENGTVWVDYDNNGFLDLFIAGSDWNTAKSDRLYRNHGNGNHWLKAKLVGTASNRDGIGAKVRVTATIAGRTFTQMREISGNSGYHGVPLLAHFGLGDATNATTVRIEWPSGTVQQLTKVAADQSLVITEPAIGKITVSRAAEGLRLGWRGEPNTPYVIQGSATLTDWGKEQSATADATGTASATLAIGPGPRFFRVTKE